MNMNMMRRLRSLNTTHTATATSCQDYGSGRKPMEQRSVENLYPVAAIVLNPKLGGAYPSPVQEVGAPFHLLLQRFNQGAARLVLNTESACRQRGR